MSDLSPAALIVDASENEATLHDLDSGAGSEHNIGVSLRKTDSGGSVELGTASDPVRTDPTGTTTQPISAASLPLPAGAATDANLVELLARVGDDIASPAANSLGARLKSLVDLLTLVKDTDGVKKITDALPAGTNEIGLVGQGTKAAGAGAWPTTPVDAGGGELSFADNEATASREGFLIGGRSAETPDVWRPVSIVEDSAESLWRLAVTSKSTLVIPPPPAGGTEVQMFADNPLDVTTSHDTTVLITNAKTLHIQQVVAGCEGDPNERGSKVEIYYKDSGSTLHLIDRIYIQGETQYGSYPDTSAARDGTAFTGDGVTAAIVLRRERLGGSATEMDVVIRGFEI